ncbi:hypothetical protein ACERK3_15005 [Phycisphaerales bacterium AB-hyl4]|uniref:Uncharacterized protein n=1 Tax=Natronomicrosphaera hydrolytica TaxID=3242702 RepID=A0ABV4U7K4_9BACT
MGSLTSGLSSVDPNVWMVSLPVVVALVAVAMQPAESTLRRWGRELLRADAMAWGMVSGQMAEDKAGWPTWRSGLLCAATTALTIATLLSMARYAGLLG